MYYADLYRERYTWAFAARDEFIESLQEPTIQNLFGRKNERSSTVALFGQTGVGKTTLILKLLGVDESVAEDGSSNFVRVAEALRGSTATGGPGTATATIYRVSINALFRIKLPGEQEEAVETLSELKARLQDVRKRVEARTLRSTEPIHISLGRNYFPTDYDPQNLTVIDLPGLGSNEEREKEHVEELLHEIVRFATTILLVLRADDVARLDRLELPGLGPWQHFHEKCLLVVTYSSSAQSIREFLTSKLAEGLDEKGWLDQFAPGIPQINRCKDFASCSLFPLEYGHSWHAFGQGDQFPKEQRLVAPIINRLTQRLRDEILKASRPEHALGRLTGLAVAVERYIEYTTADRTAKIAVLEESLKDTEAQHGQSKIQIKQCEVSKKEADTRLDEFTQKVKNLGTLCLNNQIQEPADRPNNPTRYLLDGYSEDLCGSYKQQSASHIDQFNEFSKYEIDKDSVFAKPDSGLHLHWTGKVQDGLPAAPEGKYAGRNIWTLWLMEYTDWDWWDRHRNCCKQCLAEIKNKFADLVNIEVGDLITKERADLKKDCDHWGGSLSYWQEVSSGLSSRCVEMKMEKAALDVELSAHLQRTSADLAQVKDFINRLLTALRKDIEVTRREINSQPQHAAANVFRLFDALSKITWMTGLTKSS
jgi:GTPase SAR1 family protein